MPKRLWALLHDGAQDHQASETGEMKRVIFRDLILTTGVLLLALVSFGLSGANAIAAQDVKAPTQNAGVITQELELGFMKRLFDEVGETGHAG